MGRENPSSSGVVLPLKHSPNPCGRGGARVCPGRKPKGVRGLLDEASQLPDFKGEGEMRLKLWPFVFLLILEGCSEPSSQTSQIDFGPDLGPIDESVFTGYKGHDLQDYDAAPNDIAKSRIFERWKKDVCIAVKTPNIFDWTGRVSAITAKGLLSGPGIVIDIGDGVSVEANLPQGPLLELAATLSIGQDIKFSGTFNPGKEGCPVDLIGPPWGDDRIRKPDFDVTLKSIST